MTTAHDEKLPLTGLRGVAACLVVAHHAEIQTMLDMDHALFRGQTWVDLFFVLSGYVMALVYLSGTKVNFRAFYAARFGRIYPLHIFSAVAMMFAVCIFAKLHHAPMPARLNPVQALRELTLTMALPVVGAVDIWNYPAWSISVEWWVYLTVFPALAFLGRFFGPMTWLAIGGIAMAALAYYLMGLPIQAHFTRGWTALFRGMAGFVAGYGIRRLELSMRVPPMPAGVHDAISIIAIGLIYAVPPFIGYRDAWPVMLLFPFVIWGCLTSKSATNLFLSSKPVVWLGTISYSIYLMHPLVVAIWRAAADRYHLEWIEYAVPICLTGAIALSAITYAAIEMPARQVFRSMLDPGRAPTAQPTTP